MVTEGLKFTNFSYNWNNKLCCKSFTTIRLRNPDKYRVGSIHQIMLSTKDNWKTDFGRAKVVEVREIQGCDLNEFIAQLDTGYSLSEMKKVLSNMYKGKDIDKTIFSLVLFKYV